MPANGFSAYERSLLDAFASGVAWSPSYHQRWASRAAASDTARNIDYDPEAIAETLGRQGRAMTTIEAEVIRQALAGEIQTKDGGLFTIGARGALIKEGARIVGALDLSAIRFDRPIDFENCVFEGPIILRDAHLSRLSLRGSIFEQLDGKNVTIDGDLDLSGRPTDGGNAPICQEEGAPPIVRVDLVNARVDGDVSFIDRRIDSAGTGASYALELDAIEIERDLMLNRVNARGGVNLRGAKIRASIFADGATLRAAETDEGAQRGLALRLRSAEIGGSVNLRKPFSALGEVAIDGATIRGDFHCRGGAFNAGKNEDGQDHLNAIYADAVKVQRSVFLDAGFSAVGQVNFLAATVDGQFSCRSGSFLASRWSDAPKGAAIQAEAITIGSHLLLDGDFSAKGQVIFSYAKIGGGVSCKGGAFVASHSEANALTFELSTIDANLSLCDLKAFEGALSLKQAKAATLADDEGADGATTPQIISLDGFEYDRFTDGSHDNHCDLSRGTRISWLQKQPDCDLKESFKPQPWTHCANVLKRMGHVRDARLILNKRERSLLRSRKLNIFEWGSAAILGATSGHGYRNHLALLWMLGFWAVGWLLFAVANDAGLMRPATEEWVANQPLAEALGSDFGLSAELPDAYEPMAPAVYSIDVFLPIVDFYQSRYWLPRYTDEVTTAINVAETSPWLLDANQWFGLPPAIAEPMNLVVQPVMGGLAAALTWLFSISNFLKLWFWIEIVAGWALTTIAIAGLAGVLERDRR